MDVFIAIAILVALALVATSRRFYTFRRSRIVTLLVAGGWPAVIVGVLLGPSASGLIADEAVLNATPFLLIALGWVGLMVGLQARWGVLKSVPREVARFVGFDLLFCVVLGGGVIGASLWFWARPASLEASLLTPWALLVAGLIGWSMETRSLRSAETSESRQLGVIIRVGGALSAIGAVALFGALSLLVTRDESGSVVVSISDAWVELASSVFMAILLGILGRYAIARAARSTAEQLAVFLGLVALIAGIAVEFGASPIFSALLAGLVIANLLSPEALKFERFILQAEHIIAVVVFALAGLLADLRIGAGGIAAAMALSLSRLVIKPLAVRLGLRRALESSATRLDDADDLLRLAPLRQSPLAIALALSLALIDPSPFSRELLTVVLLSGILSEIFALIIQRGAELHPVRAQTPEEAPA